MANKKDFSKIGSGMVYSSIEQGISERGQQGTASKEEAAERAASLQTQGRKGCKALRINMAFTPGNHEYIKTMAKMTGKTMTEYTNLVIERYRTQYDDKYAKLKEIIDQI